MDHLSQNLGCFLNWFGSFRHTVLKSPYYGIISNIHFHAVCNIVGCECKQSAKLRKVKSAGRKNQL